MLAQQPAVQLNRPRPQAGWPEEYVTERADQARSALADLGIRWDERTNAELRQAEGLLDASEAPEAIRQAAEDLEPLVRQATGSAAPYTLTIETAEVDAYWSYWLDGAGYDVRLRLNLPNAEFTQTGARQFALHEVLGHGLQARASPRRPRPKTSHGSVSSASTRPNRSCSKVSPRHGRSISCPRTRF
ncbi:hypothetical protein [Actinomadura pelletieri]|uniref:hypothetical protein n=1 Tax=Actinomadura pelletieri TaxID=111805 RepID=UPI001476C806|nr:hypothetical protein [Actinomadura pelletieri]